MVRTKDKLQLWLWQTLAMEVPGYGGPSFSQYQTNKQSLKHLWQKNAK